MPYQSAPMPAPVYSPPMMHPAPAPVYSPPMQPMQPVPPMYAPPVASVPVMAVAPAPAVVTAAAVTPQEQWLVESCWNGKVTLKSHNNLYLRADRDDLRVVNLVPHCRTWEKWWKTDLGHGRVAFQSKFGTYLQAQPCGALVQSRTRGDWEIWTQIPLPGGKFAFMNVHGKLLRAPGC
jgi:hypothetical protein